jgi:hypothetical protein
MSFLWNRPGNGVLSRWGHGTGNGVFGSLLGRKGLELRAVGMAVATKNDDKIIIVSRFPRI